MKILKHGMYYNDPNKPIMFSCEACGCRFEAEPFECKAIRTLDTNKSRSRNGKFVAVFREFYSIKCPECDEILVSMVGSDRFFKKGDTK